MIKIILYKNLKKKYLDNFKNRGDVLISPISNFRIIESQEKNDDLEGTSGLRFRPKEIIRGYSDEFPFPSNCIIMGTKPGARPFIQLDPGSNVDIHTHIPNAYAFCVSEKPLMHLGEASYGIKDPIGFGYSLVKALKGKGKNVVMWRLAKVQYGIYKDDITSVDQFNKAKEELAGEVSRSAYFIKPSRFMNEIEWRYVFILDDDNNVDKEVVVQDKGFLEFCDL